MCKKSSMPWHNQMTNDEFLLTIENIAYQCFLIENKKNIKNNLQIELKALPLRLQF